ncbi:MAG: 50S ribosomal protein L32 [Actinomycetota bacterium]
MPVPKRHKSRAKAHSHKANWRARAATYSLCPQCHQAKLPHRICPTCGSYAGREVLKVE